MKRLALIGDSHFNVAPGGRFEECVRIHDWIADDIAKRSIHLVVHSGDIYERRSTPVERTAVAAWIQKVTEHAPMLIVRGNHDALVDLEVLGRLETENEVIVEERAGVHRIGGFVVGALAWPSKASVLAMSGATSHEEGELVAGQLLRNVLRGMGAQMTAEQDDTMGDPTLLVAHAMVRGSRVSTGQPLVGCDLELGIEDLALAGANFNALGHIHLPQSFGPSGSVCRENEGLLGNTARYVYPGSPRRTAFGELESKGYVIVDFHDDGTITWSRVLTPCTPMVQLYGEWCWENYSDDTTFRPCLVLDHDSSMADVRGAEVRLRYAVESDRRVEAKASAEALRDRILETGALSVKVEEIVVTHGTARAPEVAQAITVADKLYALWRARGNEPEPARADRLIGMVQQLEENVA